MFVPGSNDPIALDLAMRTALAESLTHIVSVAGSELDLTVADIDEILNEFISHRIKPGLFGRYYKLVLALENGDADQARALSNEIRLNARHHQEFEILTLTDADLGPEKEIYTNVINPDPKGTPWIVSPRSSHGFGPLVVNSIQVIEEADAELSTELFGLVTQIVGASGFRGPGARPFGSASSLMLWGLLLIDAERYGSVLEMIQGIVHKSAHLLLFAHSIYEPLVTNAIDERFISPLRSDPRPMDGVFHATFVTARLHRVNKTLLECFERLEAPPFSRDELDQKLHLYRDLYFRGLETVQKHGKLTATGQRIIEETVDYMRAAY